MPLVSRKFSPEMTRLKIKAWCDKAERSHWDVRKKLTEWGIPHVEKEQLISELISHDLLNEKRYASAYAHDKSAFNKWGPKKIELILKSKGVSERNIREALGQLDVSEERKTIRDLIQKKEPQLKGLQLYQKKIRLNRYLLSKGFRQEIIQEILQNDQPD